MYFLERRMRWITVFVVSYLVIGTSIALWQWNWEFMYYAGVVFILAMIVAFIDRRAVFTTPLLWCLALWGCIHLAGGLMPIPAAIAEPGDTDVLYNMRLLPWLPKFDQVVHAYGFGLCTVIAYQSLSAHFGKALKLTLPILCTLFLIALGLGAANEMIEFIAVLLVPATNVGGYFNTGWDMVSNAAGAFLGCLFLKIRA